MSLFNSLDRDKYFGEFNSPRASNSGMLTPAQQKALAVANLGIVSLTNFAPLLNSQLAVGVGPSRFTAQPTYTQAAPASVDATATMTGANLLNGIITSTSAAAVAATLPLGTAMDTAMGAAGYQIAANDSFEFSVINTGPSIWTLTANTGFTIVGNAAVPAAGAGILSSAIFRCRRSATGTWIAYRIA